MRKYRGRYVMDCENCGNYVYDEDYDEYVCCANMDEDEYMALLSNERFVCPYQISNDEYKIVRKQI